MGALRPFYIILVLFFLSFAHTSTLNPPKLDQHQQKKLVLLDHQDLGLLSQNSSKGESFTPELLDIDVSIAFLSFYLHRISNSFDLNTARFESHYRFVQSGPSPPVYL